MKTILFFVFITCANANIKYNNEERKSMYHNSYYRTTENNYLGNGADVNCTDLKKYNNFVAGLKKFLVEMKYDFMKTAPKRRRRSISEKLKFTDFLENAVIILKTYDDDDLGKVFEILDDEIRKYHYKGCKFHELTENHEFRRLVSDKLEEVKKTPPKNIRFGLDVILNALQNRLSSGKRPELMSFLNSLYGPESTYKLASLLNNLRSYKSNTRRSYIDLLSLVKDGIRDVLFDHYSNLNVDARNKVKMKLETYWTDKQNNKINHQFISLGLISRPDEKEVESDSTTVKAAHDRPRLKKERDHRYPSPVPIDLDPAQIEDQNENHNLNKGLLHPKNKKKRHRNKERITTETEKNCETLMTLYPEEIKIKKKRKRSKHKSTTPYNDVHLSLRKGRNSSYIHHLRKPNILTHKRIINFSDFQNNPLAQFKYQRLLRKKQNLDKQNKEQNHNVRYYRNGMKIQSEESIATKNFEYEPTSRQHKADAILHATKFTYERKRNISTHNRGFDKDDDTSVEVKNSMRFRNINSNEGMSIEGYEKPTTSNRFSYRKFFSNNRFENENMDTEDNSTIKDSTLDENVIKRIDNLERELKDVKARIADQREKLNIENVSSMLRTANEPTKTISELNSNENKQKLFGIASLEELVHSTETSTVAVKSPESTVNTETTTTTTTEMTTTAKTESTSENETKDIYVGLSSEKTEKNQTRKEMPDVRIRKTINNYDYGLPKSESDEFSVTGSIPVHFDEIKGNVTDNEAVKDTDLRKTGSILDKDIEDNNKTKTELTPRHHIENMLFNSSIEHEDKEKERKIQEKIHNDLRKIFGENGRMNFNIGNRNMSHALMNSRRSLGGIHGEQQNGEVGSYMSKLNLDDKDVFGSDLDGFI